METTPLSQRRSILQRWSPDREPAGSLLRNGGFPENFIVNNPQFNGVQYNTNPGNSIYHSLTDVGHDASDFRYELAGNLCVEQRNREREFRLS